MTHTLEFLATHLHGRLIGDGTIPIDDMSSLEEAEPGKLTFAEDAQALQRALATSVAAVVVPLGLDDLQGRSGIQVASPKLAFALLLELFHPESAPQGLIHPTAVLGRDVQLAADVSVGPHAVLGDRVVVGRGTIIGAGVYVGDETTIGEDCALDPNVVIYRRTVIGRRVRIHGGSVIGGDGFGYVFHQGRYVKVPQVGNVVIEDDVEIGCNVCVDRATIGSTLIQQGTKIDNLVQVAHNNRIGKHVVMAGQVGLAGSVSVGDYVMMGGRAGVIEHVTIGPQARLGVATIATKSVKPQEEVLGFPARPARVAKRQMAMAARLPVLWKTVSDVLQRLARLEEQAGRRPPAESSP